jgi:stress response protein YsnF
MQDATSILSRYGGYGASRRFVGTGDYTAGTGAAQTGMEDAQQLKLREEQLRVRKQPVETGEARLRKDVVSEQQSMDVPVTHEEVYIERRPGSGQPSDQPIGESET